MNFLQANERFCRFLSENTQTPIEYIKYLAQYNSKSLTIGVYGIGNCIKIRDFLRNKREEHTKKPKDTGNNSDSSSSSKIRACTLNELKKIYLERFSNRNAPFLRDFSFYDFLKMEVRKLSIGMFEDILYNIRFFEFSNSQNIHQNHDSDSEVHEVQDLGSITIGGQVVGNEKWWYTPAEVEIGDIRISEDSEIKIKLELLAERNLTMNQIVKIVIFDPNFIESVRLLEHFICKGMLQFVDELEVFEQDVGKLASKKIKRSFLQIQIGNSDQHYVKFA
jgi:hypothetical protein